MAGPGQIWNVEWPNVNAQRKHPLAQDATLKDTTGTFEMPTDLIVDFVFPIHVATTPTIDPTLFHVSQVGIFGSGVVLSFAYNGETFATVSISSTGFVPYSTYPVIGANAFFDSRGWITIGKLENAFKSAGAFDFDLAGGRIHPGAIRPDIRAVTSITVADSNGTSDPITGDISLRSGTNFRFRVERKEDFPSEFPPRTRDRIYFDAIDSTEFEEDCECNDLDESAPCVRSINGINPTAEGAFQLTGSACIEIQSTGSGVRLVDKCSEPCCDCQELDAVATGLQILAQQVADLEYVSNRLETEVNATRINLLASKTTGLPS